VREGKWPKREDRPPTPEHMRMPSVPRLDDPARSAETSELQVRSAAMLGTGGEMNLVQVRRGKTGEPVEPKA